MQKTLGGDRLGSGKKMQVDMHGWQRSTHDVGYVWRSTMAAGTLVPFLSEILLPGDTYDINLNCDVKTHPTIGPLFGSYKVQLDTFLAPIRLYQGILQNNPINIGRVMSTIKIPQIGFDVKSLTVIETANVTDWDNYQVNSSCVMKYLGIAGFGSYINNTPGVVQRLFSALEILTYWDTYKNYYANKQEEIGAVIHTAIPDVVTTVTQIDVRTAGVDITVPLSSAGISAVPWTPGSQLRITYAGTPPIPNTIIFSTVEMGDVYGGALATLFVDTGTMLVSTNNEGRTLTIRNWRYRQRWDVYNIPPQVVTFPLANLDTMRNYLIRHDETPVTINAVGNLPPYSYLWQVTTDGRNNTANTQEGLAIKTYQSDLFNNWIKTDWIDGVGGINEISAIDVSGGFLTLDALLLGRKVYDMLNRVAVSGGTYNDWINVMYDHEPYKQCTTPMYMGGLIKELVFQEVVSNSESESGQPLGTLAGKGRLSDKHKGGHVVVKCDEPSVLIGIVSITPRVDYSQGNKWSVHLKTIDDLHKPPLDQIGFQELLIEQMAAWDTHYDAGNDTWLQLSAGKQPAWINYMTNVNKTYGNFAIATNEMFMTLNRRYEPSDNIQVDDLTTYIDPAKFNFIFAETALDAQNFWTQIGVNMTARRKMSGKLMPNL